MITAAEVKELKEDLRISHDTEDERLKRMLESSYKVIQERCGAFDIAEDKEGKELVMNRARYAYHDSVEFFEDNFLSELHAFGMSKVVLEDEV